MRTLFAASRSGGLATRARAVAKDDRTARNAGVEIKFHGAAPVETWPIVLKEINAAAWRDEGPAEARAVRVAWIVRCGTDSSTVCNFHYPDGGTDERARRSGRA